jgi:leucyl-tRNA synthetase
LAVPRLEAKFLEAIVDFKAIEQKWQARWNEDGLYRTPANPDADRKYYLLEMFAYPSGDIHMGHFRNYSLGDVIWRYKRMLGQHLLHPFGWDAFGLPAEQAAIQRDIHPAEWTEGNIATGRKTLETLGISYDWDREVVTCRPDYYRWTQWIFLELLERGLAYQDEGSVNWCPECNTALANAQVESDGSCWRHPDTKVERRYLKQWYFRITEYAQRLLDSLDDLEENWPESTVAKQRHWIGRSTGAELDFSVVETGDPLPIFTTRPDTVFGVTFMAIAPDAKLMRELVASCPNREPVEEYILQASLRSEIDRSAEDRDKDGVDTGLHVRNPFNGDEVPLFVADYVLAGYGSGAVMAVPAHDQRDFEFARKYDIPIHTVIRPADGDALVPDEMDAAFVRDGVMHASGPFDGTPNREGIAEVAAFADEQGFGKATVQFKLRDWLISRQRYWGAPIPVVHCPDCGVVPVPRDQLPVVLPDVKDFLPRGRSPLADVDEFIRTPCPTCGKPAERDADTMDTFVCSSWYQLRYADPTNADALWDREALKTWLPVDLYIGGAEHATLHLMYFRFITKVLFDAGWSEVDEPVTRLFHHGMVHDEHGDKMSKSKGNAISPVALIQDWGVDIPRTAMLFLAPPDTALSWANDSMIGAKRFLSRASGLVERTVAAGGRMPGGAVPPYPFADAADGERAGLRKLHQTVRKVTGDLDRIQFNTAIAALMELLNVAGNDQTDSTADVHVAGTFAQLIAPFAPHLAEELWSMLGGEGTVFDSTWPAFDEAACVEDAVTIAVQIKGKLRGTFQVPRGTGQDTLLDQVYADERLAGFAGPRDALRRVIHLPDRILNLLPG